MTEKIQNYHRYFFNSLLPPLHPTQRCLPRQRCPVRTVSGHLLGRGEQAVGETAPQDVTNLTEERAGTLKYFFEKSIPIKEK